MAALAAGQEARGQLQAANAELMSELAEMRSRSGAGVDVAEALADMRRHYEGMLRRERDRREAAETGAGSDVRER